MMDDVDRSSSRGRRTVLLLRHHDRGVEKRPCRGRGRADDEANVLFTIVLRMRKISVGMNY